MCVHTKVAINAAAICRSTNRTNTINISRLAQTDKNCVSNKSLLSSHTAHVQ